MSKKKNPLPWYDLHSSACWQKKRNQDLLASPPLSGSRVIVTSSSYIACQSYLVSCNLFFECLFYLSVFDFCFCFKSMCWCSSDGMYMLVQWQTRDKNDKNDAIPTTIISQSTSNFHLNDAIHHNNIYRIPCSSLIFSS